MSELRIRELTREDQAFLWEMLYLSLFVPEGGSPFPRSIVKQPRLAAYVDEWGRCTDLGFVADLDGKLVGAAWCRLFDDSRRGYGYIDDATPELGMAVLPAHRGQGIGHRLLQRLLTAAADRYPKICLSVSIQNPARNLYRRAGFEVVGDDGESCTMLKVLDQSL